ncbi:hypothetical protein JCM11491_000263 [Sporobolomyces phaffii]
MSTTASRPPRANPPTDQRPRQAPPLQSTPSPSTPSLASRDDSLLEAALENRRKNGVPTLARPPSPTARRTRTDPAATVVARSVDPLVAPGQFDDSDAGTLPQQATRRVSQRESLTPLSHNVTLARMTSTRRYMDQLDEDDVEAMDDIDPDHDDAPDHGDDRATWYSGWGSEPRDSVASLAVTSTGTKGQGEVARESALSTKTFESGTPDAFHYSMYETMHSPVETQFVAQPSRSLAPEVHSPRPPSTPVSPPSSVSSPSISAPVVRIGPPSPTTATFLDDPQASTTWNDLPSSPPASPVSPDRKTALVESPRSPSTTNRVPSQTSSKNFSRPFVTIPSPPLPNARTVAATGPGRTFAPQRPATPRTDSLESSTSPNPLDRKSSLGANSSSLGHSGSSAGGHSMSASWEDRKLLGLRQHEEAKRAINLAREQSQRIREERDTGGGDTSVEELRSIVGDDGGENGAYGGEEEEENEASIHFAAVALPDDLPESPYLAYAAPSPPTHSPRSLETSHPYSAFAEELPRSPPPQILSHSASPFSADPRPAPAPPMTHLPSATLALPVPGSPAQRRRPSDTPSLASSTGHSRDGPIVLSASAPSGPSSSTIPPPKQRNVLRKARPVRRADEEPPGLSAPMSRAGSAWSSHSHASLSSSTTNGEPSTSSTSTSSRWSRFRSRSKSRTRTPASILDEGPSHSAPLPAFPPPASSFSTSSDPSGSASLQSRHHPEPSLVPLDPRPLRTFPSPSTTAPLSHADFARLEASRPAFLRAKTSTGVLKNVAGPKSVQTGLVHPASSSAAAASIHNDDDNDRGRRVRGGVGEDVVESLDDDIGRGRPPPLALVSARPRLGLGGTTATMMNRSVSDQGPSTTTLRSVHDRHASSGANSVSSSSVAAEGYSIYSLPPSPLDTLPTTRTAAVAIEHLDGTGRGAVSSQRNSTVEKAKVTLGGGAVGSMRGLMATAPFGNGTESVTCDPVTPEDFLQVGINHHEAGELERAAWCFEQSAKKDGGCGGGMLMYGLTLRHGWGCQLNAPLGFRYLQMAAESVVEDLDRVVFGGRTLTESEANTKAAKSELVLALHEIGVSYRFGWGVEKNKKMAVSYFTLSADLGDGDAQQDVAFCYANGKGCKKDMKKAAHYYRLAIAQGAAEDWGLSWIYKASFFWRNTHGALIA